jgi:hypothetical protein
LNDNTFSVFWTFQRLRRGKKSGKNGQIVVQDSFVGKNTNSFCKVRKEKFFFLNFIKFALSFIKNLKDKRLNFNKNNISNFWLVYVVSKLSKFQQKKNEFLRIKILNILIELKFWRTLVVRDDSWICSFV